MTGEKLDKQQVLDWLRDEYEAHRLARMYESLTSLSRSMDSSHGSRTERRKSMEGTRLKIEYVKELRQMLEIELIKIATKEKIYSRLEKTCNSIEQDLELEQKDEE